MFGRPKKSTSVSTSDEPTLPSSRPRFHGPPLSADYYDDYDRRASQRQKVSTQAEIDELWAASRAAAPRFIGLTQTEAERLATELDIDLEIIPNSGVATFDLRWRRVRIRFDANNVIDFSV